MSIIVHTHDVSIVEIYFLVVNVMRIGVGSHVGGVVNVATMVVIVLLMFVGTVGNIVITMKGNRGETKE